MNDALTAHLALFESMREAAPQIEAMGRFISQRLKAGSKVMFAGNGGSAADAQHMAAELTGRFMRIRPGMAALALTTDTSALTAIANDFGFDQVFARQVEALGRAGDVLVLLSTSGQSMNLINAAKVAKRMGIETVGLLGRGGGVLKEFCGDGYIVKSDDTARIQEAHGFIGHCLCAVIEGE